MQQAYVGYVYGDSTAGQRALYEVGMTGIPVVNVNNNCSTGSTALFLARQAVASGAADCVLALGFEHMSPGALGAVFNDRPSPFDHFENITDELVGNEQVPLALRYFGGAGLAHMQQYGTQMSTFAKIRAKASRHASNNPVALFRTVVTEDEVMAAPVMWPGVMTRLMACALIRTLRSSPWRSAKRAEHTMAAAAPQVGGQAISRVITPGQITWSFMTSSALTSLRNSASGLFLAWRLALARTFANEVSGVPYFFMWLRPAPPK